MDLEEQTGVEHAGDRCESCGAQLTETEQQEILETGAPVLCATCADEADTAPGEDEAEAE